MAKGDVVNGFLTATGNFQPASGVEVMITELSATGTGDVWQLYDGTNAAHMLLASSGARSAKLGITNTRYLRFVQTTNTGGYTGVQTK